MKKCYFKNIRLYPTEFEVDIWVCKDIEFLSKKFHDRYGASIEYYKDELRPNATQTVVSTLKSELKGDKIIIVNVETFNTGIFLHELNHVVYYLYNIIHADLHYSAQE